ncbi:MAG: hypothetical protein MRY51_09135 [Flavobacteriaceae bacterium]|nr:hypothetical protein [Flavobacteriaceae bacterium]MCI5089251.1 hypothetical protein [Flavobacteriaceae bacterium]
MKYLLLFFTLFLCQPIFSQQSELSKKELRIQKRAAKKKASKATNFKELNEYGIDIYATNVIQAIRKHLGNAKIEGDKVVVTRDRIGSFSDGEPPYAIWDVDGNLIGKTPPPGLDLLSIRKVTVYRTVYDIQTHYGFNGGQGVIKINTTLTMPDNNEK